MSTVEDRIRGSLLGLAWGDAFGCPIESWRATEIAEVYGRYERLPDPYPFDRIARLGKNKLKRLRPLGLHSDDTQQCLALMQAALAPGGWDPATWADCLVEGMRRQAWRGYGRNFTFAVHKLRRGEVPQRSGAPTAGIGSVMRIGPLGAVYRDDPAMLARVSVESSLTTHGDIRAGAFGYAVAWSVSRLLAGQAVGEIQAELAYAVALVEREWLEGHADWTSDRSAGPQVSRILRDFFTSPPPSPEEIRTRVSHLARPHLPPEFTVANPNQGFVLLGGLHALALALSVEEPQHAFTEIAAQGYDIDTVAAICGSLLGARFGIDWIPRELLLDQLPLEAYGDSLVRRNVVPEDRDTFLTREARWTRREDEFQAAVLAAHGGLFP